MKIENYYLNLKKVSKLKDIEDKERIHRYYQDMLHAATDNRQSVCLSIFNTLHQYGYIVDIRQQKIDEILDDES